jgi:hypothetical protein
MSCSVAQAMAFNQSTDRIGRLRRRWGGKRLQRRSCSVLGFRAQEPLGSS